MATKRVEPLSEDRPEGDLLQKDPNKTSRLAEVIQLFRRKQKEPRKRNYALRRYLESQERFEVGDPLGFRIDRKV